jgi:hypothetical protein
LSAVVTFVLGDAAYGVGFCTVVTFVLADAAYGVGFCTVLTFVLADAAARGPGAPSR